MARQRYQEGRLEKTGAKGAEKWKGHFYTYDNQGKRHHRAVIIGTVKEKTKTDALKEMRRIIEKETGVVQPAKETDSFGWFWEERFVPFQTWTPPTRQNILGLFRKHVLPDLNGVPLSEINKVHIQKLMLKLESKSYSLSKHIRTYLRASLREANDQGVIPKDPTRGVKILADRHKACNRHLTEQELRRLLQELSARDQLIVRIAVVCGLRPGELFALKWEDFHPETGQLRIDETYRDQAWKPTKTTRSNGWVTLPPAIAAELQLWRKWNPEARLIFSGPRKPNHPINADNFVYRVLFNAAIRAKIMQARPANLPKGARWVDKTTAVNFQAFRRTCATWCLKNGNVKDAQVHLRHTNPATTLTHYIQEIPESVRHAVEGVDSYFFSASTPQQAPVAVQ